MKKKKPLVSDLYVINQKKEAAKVDNESVIENPPAAKESELLKEAAVKPVDKQRIEKEEAPVYESDNDDPDCNWDYDACDAGDTEALFVIRKVIRGESDQK